MQQAPAEDLIFDLDPYEGTDLAVERGLAEGTECWATSAVAGLQFYNYGRRDDLIGLIIPKPGDRLAIMRRPENAADRNACEVWWRNEFHLGHLPRGVAADLAPLMDEGKGLRAYVADPGDGSTWSLRILLVGTAAGPLHGERLEEAAAERRRQEREEFRTLMASVWPEDECGYEPYARDGWWWAGRYVRRPHRPAPTPQQAAGALILVQHLEATRRQRMADALHVFASMMYERQPFPEDADAGAPGASYGWWDQVPPGCKTKTQWREVGRKVRRGAKAHAEIAYGRGKRFRCYDLFALGDTEPVQEMSATARGAQLVRDFLASQGPLPEVEADNGGCHVASDAVVL